jgi:hypothetical protein
MSSKVSPLMPAGPLTYSDGKKVVETRLKPGDDITFQVIPGHILISLAGRRKDAWVNILWPNKADKFLIYTGDIQPERMFEYIATVMAAILGFRLKPILADPERYAGFTFARR